MGVYGSEQETRAWLNYASDGEFKDFVKGIAEHVKCELYNAVAIEYAPDNPKRAMLFKWAAKIALTVRALDKSAISRASRLPRHLSNLTKNLCGGVDLAGAGDSPGNRKYVMQQITNDPMARTIKNVGWPYQGTPK